MNKVRNKEGCIQKRKARVLAAAAAEARAIAPLTGAAAAVAGV
jgi:hypothetical protein